MKFSVKFKEQQSKINVNFSDTQYASDGGFERGYEQGYKDGENVGYEKGHTSGYENGYEEGQQNGMDAVVGGFLETYRNETVTALRPHLFNGCTNLKYIGLPKVANVSDSLLANCKSLVDCDFASATTLYSSVFNGCSSLARLDFPVLASIHSGVFANCTSLTQLIIRTADRVATLGGNCFTNTPIASGSGYIYVQDGLVEQYKSATNWSVYASQIKPLSNLVE